ncbi:MAG: serine--tRNA ligase [Planctomycetes bacterium]|nr:serine--tRNA ligase [Planctomycetota bacterium]
MIDLAHFRKDPAFFRAAWSDRGVNVDVDALLAIDVQVRELKLQGETTQAELNGASKAIGQAAREGKDVAAAKETARTLGDRVRELDAKRAGVEQQLVERLAVLPNPCLAVVPKGKDAADNRVVSTWGTAPGFAFAPKAHWDLGPALDIIDFDRGAKISGSGFVALKGMGARLSRALVAFFLDRHTRRNGYTELAVPYLVQPQMMYGVGQLPKFADQLYRCPDDDLMLIPTAEVPVTNWHRDEILDLAELPKQFCAHTPCFRREAGAAGIGTRGMTRVHQFDKVEMVWLTPPERAESDLLTMRGHAESLLQELGLHYRVLELCTGDTGFSSCHTFDLEVWSAGTSSWLEVSSCSDFGEFQSRRANLKFRREKGGKPAHLATINGSGLALPRCLIALIEANQEADGSVVIPEVLRPYMDGLERITKTGVGGRGSGAG